MSLDAAAAVKEAMADPNDPLGAESIDEAASKLPAEESPPGGSPVGKAAGVNPAPSAQATPAPSPKAAAAMTANAATFFTKLGIAKAQTTGPGRKKQGERYDTNEKPSVFLKRFGINVPHPDVFDQAMEDVGGAELFNGLVYLLTKAPVSAGAYAVFGNNATGFANLYLGRGGINAEAKANITAEEVRQTVIEEAVHAVVMRTLSQQEIESLWNGLPKRTQDAVRDAYYKNHPGTVQGQFLSENAGGNEFLRMLVQGKLNGISVAGQLELTETHSNMRSGAPVREILRVLAKVYRALVKLIQQGPSTAYQQQLNAAVANVEAAWNAIKTQHQQAVQNGTAAPYRLLALPNEKDLGNDLSGLFPNKGREAKTPPNRLRIKPDPRLTTQEEREAERQFIDEMNRRTDEENDAIYDKIAERHGHKGGVWLSVDLAREMFAPYAKDPGAHSASTSAAARAYIEARFQRLVGNAEIHSYRFLAGGQASGKSSAGVTTAKCVLVYDSVFASEGKARAMLRAALETGKHVRVDYVWAPIETAVAREASRREVEGRVVRDASLAEGHFGAQQTIIKLLSDPEFKDVEFAIWDNSGGKDQQYVVGIPPGEDASSLPPEEMNKRALDFLRGSDVLYPDENNVRGRLETSRKAVLGTDSARTGPANVGGVVSKGASVNQSGRGTAGKASASGQGASGLKPLHQRLNAAARKSLREKRVGGRWARFRRNWIDASAIVSDFVADMQDAGILPTSASDNPDTLVRRFRKTADSIVHHMLKDGMVDQWGNVMTDEAGNPIAPLSKAFEGLDEAQQKGFVEFLRLQQKLAALAKRRRDSEQRGFAMASQQKSSWLESDEAEYQQVFPQLAGLEILWRSDFLGRSAIVWRWNQGVLEHAGLNASMGSRGYANAPAGEKETKAKFLNPHKVRQKVWEEKERVELYTEIEESLVYEPIPLWDFEFPLPEDGKRISEWLKGANMPIVDPEDSTVYQAGFQILKAALLPRFQSEAANGKADMRLDADTGKMRQWLAALPKAELDAILADVQATLERFVLNGVEDVHGNLIGPALADAFDGLDADSRARFVRYLHAMRTVALDEHDGRHSGMHPHEARKIIEAESGTDFASRAKIVHDFNSAVLDFLISTDSVRGDNYFANEVGQIRNVDPGSYIPLWRTGTPYERMADKSYERGKSAGEKTEKRTVKRKVQKTRIVKGWVATEERILHTSFHTVKEWGQKLQKIVETVDWKPGESLNAFLSRGFGITEVETDILNENTTPKEFVDRQTDIARQLVIRAQKQRVIEAITKLAGANANAASAYMRRVRPDEVPGSDKAKASALRATRALSTGRVDPAMAEFLMPVVEAGKSYHVFANGSWWQVDPALIEAVNTMGQHFPLFGESAIAASIRDASAGKWFEHPARDAVAVIDFADRTLRFSASFFRAAATAWNPRFGLATNVARDFETLTYNTRSGAVPFRLWKNWVGAMWSSAVDAISAGHWQVGEAAQYRAFFEQLGLQMSQSLQQDSAPLKLSTKQVLGHKDLQTKGHDVWSFLVGVLQFPETAARIAEMKTLAEKTGWNPSQPMTPEIASQLAAAAKGVTVDFTRAGKMAQIWNAYVPFFNSGIQGKVSAYEAFKRNPKQWLATRGLAVTLSAIALWYRNKDEDWWKEMSSRDKLSYRWLLAPFGGDLGDEKTVFKIPMAFEVDAIFHGLVTSMLDGFYQGGAKDELMDWFRNMFEDMSMFGSLDGLGKLPDNVADMGWGRQAIYRIASSLNSDAMPPIVQEFFAQAFNQDRYWKRPIVPANLREEEAAEQFGRYTTNLAIWLGRKLGWSPMRIKHALRAQYAGTGDTIAATAFGRGDGEELPERDWEASDIPIFGTFFRRGAGVVNPYDSKTIQGFYDKAGQMFRDVDADRLPPELAMAAAVAVRSVSLTLQLSRQTPDLKSRNEFINLALELSEQASAAIDKGELVLWVNHFSETTKALERTYGDPNAEK
ncbi:MAG: hypothetical protein LBD14_03375 [Puniceicoccales bacterium]|nr:hypothetical protein [Puniceicoccales bacterium]